jgi:TRAP-type C4-dicarboxylate transport system permease small subunit
MRKFLDALYNSAAALAALFMVGLLIMVLLSVLGRQFIAGAYAEAG